MPPAASELRRNRMGVLGHYYCGMLDVYTDLTRLSGVFGTHFELLEMCELKTLRDEATPQQVAAKIDEFYETFDVASDCERSEIERARGRRWRSTGWSPGTLSDRWLIITKGRAITRTSSHR